MKKILLSIVFVLLFATAASANGFFMYPAIQHQDWGADANVCLYQSSTKLIFHADQNMGMSQCQMNNGFAFQKQAAGNLNINAVNLNVTASSSELSKCRSYESSSSFALSAGVLSIQAQGGCQTQFQRSFGGPSVR